MKKLIQFTLLFASLSAHAAYQIDVEISVRPPPAPNSNADKRDYVELHEWQGVRSPQECAIAASQWHMQPAEMFGPKLKILTAAELAVLTPIMKELIATANVETWPLKEHYARLRPYEADRSIYPCVQKPKGGTSYPSTHAVVGKLLGLVLADLIPAKAEVIEAAGMQVGENRIIGGVHHPSDVLAGQAVAKQISDALETNEDFQADFKAAKRELRARARN